MHPKVYKKKYMCEVAHISEIERGLSESHDGDKNNKKNKEK